MLMMSPADMLSFFNIIIALLVAVLFLLAFNLLVLGTLWVKVGRLNSIILTARAKRRKSTAPVNPEDLAPVSPSEDKYRRPASAAAPRRFAYSVIATITGKKVPMDAVENAKKEGL